ncbi:MAG: UvrD-helicase domain-containing protein, partial [Acidimicrobiales bacterium]
MSSTPTMIDIGRQRPDHAARRRITQSLDETLFVEAGAGSGKTRALVDRVVALVTNGTVRLAEIAAITFTEKAAAELRDRVRHELTAARDRALAAAESEAVRRCADALDDLDGAAIGTLHSFAQRILIEHPLEAGLPPRLDVQGEVASAVAFEHRWASFVDELLADSRVERALLLATAAGVRLAALRAIASAFDDNWDLVSDHAPRTPVEPPPWAERLDELLDELDAACAQAD